MKRRIFTALGFLIVPVLAGWLALTANPGQAAAAFETIGGVTTSQSRTFYDRLRRIYFTQNTVTNASPDAITGPLRLVVQNPTLPVLNADGTTAAGESFFNIFTTSGETLAPGATTATIRINFRRLRIRLSYTLRVEQEPPADVTAPLIAITDPADGAIFGAGSITVGGTVDDATAAVTVNGIPAPVAGGAFTATGVPLVEGPNILTAAAVDPAGNVGTANIQVILDRTPPPAPSVFEVTTPTILAFQTLSGEADPNSMVDVTGGAEAARVEAFGSGLYMVNVPLRRNAINRLSLTATDRGGNTGPPAEVMIVQSDDIPPPESGEPTIINVASGNNQFGMTGEALPQPLVVVVTEPAGDPVVGVDVTFRVTMGGANIGGGATAMVETDGEGKAAVDLILGPEAGLAMVRVNFAGNQNMPAEFMATGLAPRPIQETRLSGVVMTPDFRAIPGATITFQGRGANLGINLSVVTNALGGWALFNVPPGDNQILFVEGRTATLAPERFPNLTFDIDVLPGQDNLTGRRDGKGKPLFLPPLGEGVDIPLDADDRVIGDHLIEFAAGDGVEPIKLTVAAGTLVTFPPDAERLLSITRIPINRIPMPLPEGRFSQMVITVQPSGVTFDPPLPISFPNVDGIPPGTPVELLSFSLAAGDFISVGSATVSADGRSVVSDPGVGIREGTWHATPPNPPSVVSMICAELPPAAATLDCECWASSSQPAVPVDDKFVCAGNVPVGISGIMPNAEGELPDTVGCVCSFRPVLTKVIDGLTPEQVAEKVFKPDDFINVVGDVEGVPNAQITFTVTLNGAVIATETVAEGATFSFAPLDVGIFTITATVDPGGGTTIADSWDINVGGLDLIAHKPKVIAPGEPEIADGIELSKGAQTFVNLDNDDKRNLYDSDLAKASVAGEDEMVKVKLKLTPKEAFDSGTAKLEATAGAAQIRVWKKADRSDAYALGAPLAVPADFQVEGDSLVATLWVEGTAPHTAQQATKLKMTYDQLPGEEDSVAITIIGIEKIEWVGRSNGLSGTNALGADPNWPAGLVPGAVRVFPDARKEGAFFPSPGDVRDKVDVKVTLSVDPIEPVDLFFVSIDVDDPTSDVAPLDGEVSSRDNRGATPDSDGKITGADATGVAAVSFTTKEATFEFQTTMQPGDNFRIAGNGDKNFVSSLVNLDPILNTSNADKQRITHLFITGTAVQQEIRQPDKYASNKVLTVWRFMHIEHDSMGPVVDNFIEGNIVDLEGLDGFATAESSEVKRFQTDVTVGDESDDLNTTVADRDNGRFEKGTVTVAGGLVTFNNLDGNGNFFLQRAASMDVNATPLPFTAVDNDIAFGSTLAGTITNMQIGGAFLKLNVTANSQNPIDWPDFVGGKLSIAGGPGAEITDVTPPTGGNPAEFLLGTGPRIPFRVVDDDPPAGTDVAQADTTVLATSFKPAYILPQFDLGSDTNLTFIANIASSSDDDVREGWDFDNSGLVSNKNFWTVYLRGAFQHTTDRDGDPDGEGAVLGIVDNINGSGTNIYTETFRPAEFGPADPANGISEPHTVGHEIGHLFNGLHSDCSSGGAAPCADAGLMAQTSVRADPDFNEVSLDKIRRVIRPGLGNP